MRLWWRSAVVVQRSDEDRGHRPSATWL